MRIPATSGFILLLALVCGITVSSCAGRRPSPTAQADEAVGPAETSATAQAVRFDPQETLVPLEPAVRDSLDPDKRFSLGIDRFAREDFSRLDHRRVLVVTSRLAVDSRGRHLLEILLPLRKPLVEKVVLFNDELPAPGRSAAIDRIVGAHPSIRVFERSPAALELAPSMIDGVDVVLLDVPMRPARFYPEANFIGAVLSAAALHSVPVIVLDRPLPFDGDLFDGPPASVDSHRSPVAYYPTLAVPGLTAGELARLYATKYGAQARVEVVEMLHWSRRDGHGKWLAELALHGADPSTGLEEWNRYVFPSPRHAEWQLVADLLPPAFGASLVAGPPASLDVRTGSKAPADAVAALLPILPPGVSVAVSEQGVRLASDALFPPVAVAFAIRSAIDPAAGWEGLDPIASPAVSDSLRQGRDPREIRRLWGLSPESQEFSTRRQDFVIYR